MDNKFTIEPDFSIMQAMQKIDANQESFLICVDEENIVLGTITDGDIRRSIIKNKSLDSTIKDVMSKGFESLNAQDNFKIIATKFKSRKINFLPIIQDGKLINILTKKQFHVMLLEDVNLNLSQNFAKYSNKILEHEVFNKPWGFYKSTLFTRLAQSKIITIFANEELSLQEHKKREEHWIVIKGEAKVILGESELFLSAGSYIYVPKGVKHQMINLSNEENLIFAEVQLGEYFGEDDIIRYKDKYNRS